MWRRSVVHIRYTGLSPEPEHYATGIIVITRRRSFAPSIGNTLWRVSTTFTRSAITTPEVNVFGWNSGNSEYIAWSWRWQILGAIRAEARAGDLAEVLFYLSGKQRTTLLISAQPNFTKFAHKTWFCEVVKPFGIIFWKFALKWSFFRKNRDHRQRFPTSSRDFSETITNLGKSRQVGAPMESWLSIRTVEINSKSFPWPAGSAQGRTFQCRVRTQNDFHRRIVAERPCS